MLLEFIAYGTSNYKAYSRDKAIVALGINMNGIEILRHPNGIKQGTETFRIFVEKYQVGNPYRHIWTNRRFYHFQTKIILHKIVTARNLPIIFW